MCGLVGAAGAIGLSEEKMVQKLLQLDTIRGPHSTGLHGVTQQGVGGTLKKTGTPFELALYRGWTKFWGKSYSALLGHNRYATVGDVNDVTAHPFTYGDISGMHNGTLKDGWKAKLDDGYSFDVDSECIINHLSVNGVDETVNKLHGAFALVWYDTSTKTLNMTRNKDRELYFCHSDDEKTLFWASESWMLTVAAVKCKVSIGKIHMLREHILFSTEIVGGTVAAAPKLTGEVRDLVQYVDTTWESKKYQTYMPRTITGTVNTTKSVTKVTDNKVAKDNDRLSNMVGKYVEFVIDGSDKDTYSSSEFLDGTVIGDEPIKGVRYYYNTFNEDAAIMMIDSGLTYTGVVRRLRNDKGGSYVVVDPRTVVATTIGNSVKM